MSVVRYISDRIGVMYLGSLAEEAPTDELFQEPLHPYTRALLSAVPDFTRGRRRERIKLQCELSAGHDRPEGCAFQARCPLATERCRREIPAFREVKPGHKVACHLIEGEETES
jgi:oligopeptide transport system ATP-binding protein